MQVKIVARGIKEFQDYLKRAVPRGAVKVALAALGEYLIGTPGKALRHYDPYKYVSRKRAYGQTFQSEKQRRWFWANGAGKDHDEYGGGNPPRAGGCVGVLEERIDRWTIIFTLIA
jgi:hypothetical protein